MSRFRCWVREHCVRIGGEKIPRREHEPLRPVGPVENARHPDPAVHGGGDLPVPMRPPAHTQLLRRARGRRQGGRDYDQRRRERDPRLAFAARVYRWRVTRKTRRERSVGRDGSYGPPMVRS